jgi:glycosyltransferase involved in cell wall biosynthesis
MLHSPKISVVMTTYNGSRFLKEAIDSILSQTFSDFEFIIWNDGSSDLQCEEIIKNYKDNRIRYFYHENTGLGKALNLAIAEARGKYIARMDDDDISLPDRFQKEYDFLEAHPDCILVSSSVFYINESGAIVGISLPYTKDSIIRRVSGCIAHPCVMFLRDAFNKTQGYPAVRQAQDTIFWSKLNKFGKFVNLKDTLLKHRIVDTSIARCRDTSSPYFKMVLMLREKMIQDDVVLSEDVDLYNYLIAQTPKISPSKSYSPPLYEKVYRLISLFVGDRYAKDVIIYLKDLYGTYKYKK